MASIGMVVADSSAPTTGDAALNTTLTGAGHTVTYISDEAAEVSSSTYDLIVLAPSLSSTTLGTKYGASYDCPVLNLDIGAQDDHEIIDVLGVGSPSAAETVTIIDTTIAGTSGSGAFASAGTQYFISTVNIGTGDWVEVLRHTGGSPSNLPVCIAYDEGGLLSHGVAAPKRRVGWFLDATAVENFTTFGNDILLGFVDWLAPASAAQNVSANKLTVVATVSNPGVYGSAVIRPNGLVSQSGWTGTWSDVDDSPSSPNDADFAEAAGSSTEIVFDLTDMPSGFDAMSSVSMTARLRLDYAGSTWDVQVYAQLLDSSNGPLSDEVAVTLLEAADSSFTNYQMNFTGVSAGNLATWNGARLKLRSEQVAV